MLVQKPFTPMSACATVQLQQVQSHICSPLETGIGGDWYMLLFIDHTSRHTDEYILMYKLEAFEKFKE
jgi:hypothetical protein